MNRRHSSSLCLVLLFAVSSCFAQEAAVHRDVAYDVDHDAQCLDVYLTKSDTPTPAMIYIHGGGWRAGSKQSVPGWLKKFVAAGELSVISVEYRFTDVAPHPAQVHDCLRAVQFVKLNAKKWNIDPDRIGVTGGSAGGHLTAYVTLNARSPILSTDVVLCESSAVKCGVSFAGPTDWSLLKTIEHGHPAYRQLLGYKPGTPADQMDEKQMSDVSPITFADKDDPPLMQVHGDKDSVVPIQHAKRLHEKLQSLGVKSELVVIPGGQHNVAGASDAVTEKAAAFVREHLLK